jgi:hypothetical protein
MGRSRRHARGGSLPLVWAGIVAAVSVVAGLNVLTFLVAAREGQGGVSGAIIIDSADWLVAYPSNSSAYLGPANQTLCSNCPIYVPPGHVFSIALSLTNHDTAGRHVFLGLRYVGCDRVFYLESTGITDPFLLGGGQTIQLVLDLYPSNVPPGPTSIHGAIQTW